MLNKKIIKILFLIAFLSVCSMPAVANIFDPTNPDTGDLIVTPDGPTNVGGSGASESGDTLGNMIITSINNSINLPNIFAFIGYMCGFLFTAVGLVKLKDHTLYGPQQVPLADPLKFFAAGGLMMALPLVATIVHNSFGGSGDGAAISVGGDVWSEEALTADAETGGLDNMLVRFMGDIYAPLQILIVFFCFSAGAALTLIAIHRFTKTAQQGAQGPIGMGTIATFILAGLLFSIAPSVGTLMETLYGGRESMLRVDFLGLSDSMGEAGNEHAERVVVSILAFLVIVGLISVVRGLFVLRGMAEGNQQMTVMSGVSHIIAGAILVNFGQFANIIQNTLGLTEYGLQFSN